MRKMIPYPITSLVLLFGFLLSSRVVAGDLAVDGNLNVASNATIQGTLVSSNGIVIPESQLLVGTNAAASNVVAHFEGDVTLSGTNNLMPNQIFINSNSVLTGKLGDGRYLLKNGGSIAGSLAIGSNLTVSSDINVAGKFDSASRTLTGSTGPAVLDWENRRLSGVWTATSNFTVNGFLSATNVSSNFVTIDSGTQTINGDKTWTGNHTIGSDFGGALKVGSATFSQISTYYFQVELAGVGGQVPGRNLNLKAGDCMNNKAGDVNIITGSGNGAGNINLTVNSNSGGTLSGDINLRVYWG